MRDLQMKGLICHEQKGNKLSLEDVEGVVCSDAAAVQGRGSGSGI